MITEINVAIPDPPIPATILPAIVCQKEMDVPLIACQPARVWCPTIQQQTRPGEAATYDIRQPTPNREYAISKSFFRP